MARLLSTPQLSLPFRVSKGEVACHEQDTDTDRVQNAVTVLRYEIGQRSAIPDFGIPDQTFRQSGAEIVALQRAIKRWEPEIDTPEINQAIDNEGLNTVSVEFTFNG